LKTIVTAVKKYVYQHLSAVVAILVFALISGIVALWTTTVLLVSGSRFVGNELLAVCSTVAAIALAGLAAWLATTSVLRHRRQLEIAKAETQELLARLVIVNDRRSTAMSIEQIVE
jgi:Kef-type K+ transport system membrane component KefB